MACSDADVFSTSLTSANGSCPLAAVQRTRSSASPDCGAGTRIALAPSQRTLARSDSLPLGVFSGPHSENQLSKRWHPRCLPLLMVQMIRQLDAVAASLKLRLLSDTTSPHVSASGRILTVCSKWRNQFMTSDVCVIVGGKRGHSQICYRQKLEVVIFCKAAGQTGLYLLFIDMEMKANKVKITSENNSFRDIQRLQAHTEQRRCFSVLHNSFNCDRNTTTMNLNLSQFSRTNRMSPPTNANPPINII
ncbi:hypothetical protein JOB18_009623 [Solea senegalensis]|uniref:Uncharacterized protein n=1 Tax=Solea senegalensis TaxID=28829 RepID=A0AAV6T4C0_SOLSE|nr:hypothetical protein JOB18_009623 [Solea senegalensis]